MAENAKTEDQLLAELRNAPVVEVTNKTPEVINTEEVKTTETTETVVTEDPLKKAETVTTEKPYYELKGFATQAELDTYIDNNRVAPKTAYASKWSEEFDGFVKATGKDDPKLFEFYKNTEIKESMEPKDYVRLIVESEIQKNPTLAKYRDMRQEELEKEYLVDMDVKEEGLSMQDLYAKDMKDIQLKAEAQKVIDDINVTREKMANSGLTKEEIAANTAKLETAKVKANDFIEKSVAELNMDIVDKKKNEKGELEILKDSEGKPVVLKSFTFEQEEKDFFKNALQGVIAEMGFPEPDSDNAKTALILAKMATKEEFELKRTKEVIAQTEARIIKQFNIDVDNPSVLKVGATSDTLEGVISEEAAIKAARGGG